MTEPRSGRDPQALLRAADVEAERGDLGRALAFVEEALAIDIDAPGARERHGRFQALLGVRKTAPRDPTPTILGRPGSKNPFRILGEVGRGGSGVVYEAFDDALGRPIALKMYHRPEKDRDRAITEARTAGALAGPGVVRIFDVDVDAGWIAMEFAARGSLAALFAGAADERLSDSGGWLVEIAQALARAHRANVVHGDVKPENVLLSADDRALLTDFGLARAPGEPYGGKTAAYASPERSAGAPAHPDDDVFAVGRILERGFALLPQALGAENDRFARLRKLLLEPRGVRPADAERLLDVLAGMTRA